MIKYRDWTENVSNIRRDNEGREKVLHANVSIGLY